MVTLDVSRREYCCTVRCGVDVELMLVVGARHGHFPGAQAQQSAGAMRQSSTAEVAPMQR